MQGSRLFKINFLVLVLSITFSGLAFCSSSYAEVQEIGSGFSCSDNTIVNSKNKVVKLGVARRKIQNKIDNLGGSAADKAKKAILKGIKAALKACTEGAFVPVSSMAGTYTGTLNRTSGTSQSALCEDRPSLEAIFPVEVNGSSIIVTGAINPFHIPVSGSVKGSGFELTGKKGAVSSNVTLTLTATNVTQESADFEAKVVGVHINQKVCTVTYAGTGFVRSE